ncbi:nuclear pore complex protein Nup85-like [Schistocerca gregaria]|uniref:nuclear pore complex protein Nup85-like n=1 Tax=Schistocerca gregaria TaxID=7010 RepID=UPI00211E8284|nr:nuclear pore complex protein Nup85-like [Schistocerca gregaria]
MHPAENDAITDEYEFYDSDKVIQINLKNVLAKNLTSRWLNSNYISLYNASPRDQYKTTVSQRNPIIQILSWDRIIAGRKLICEFHIIFVNTRTLKPAIRRPVNRDVLEISQRYQESLYSLISSHVPTKQKNSDLEIELSSYGVIGMIWNIAEIALFTDEPVLPGLLNWVYAYFSPRLKEEKIDNWTHSTCPQKDPEYWELVYAYAIRGMIRELMQLLSLYSVEGEQDSASLYSITGKSVLSQLNHILKDIPLLTKQETIQSAWTKWKMSLTDLIHQVESMKPQLPRNLVILLLILSGDINVLKQYSDNWAILLVSQIIYKHQTFKPLQLKSILEASIKCTLLPDGSIQELAGLDSNTNNLVMAVIKRDIKKIVHLILERENWWFAVHFLDLLYMANLVPDTYDRYFVDDGNPSLREYTVLEYSKTLSSNNMPIRIIADYLACCTMYGKVHLTYYLAHQPIKSQKDAAKLMSLCSVFGLNESNGVTKTISHVMMRQSLRHKHILGALSWSCKSCKWQTEKLVESVLDKFVISFVNVPIDDVDNPRFIYRLFRMQNTFNLLMSTMRHISPKVHFLNFYSEALDAYKKREYRQAETLLIEAISLEGAPKKSWLLLIENCMHIALQALPSATEYALTPKNICVLIERLEELLLDKNSEKWFENFRGCQGIQILNLKAYESFKPSIECTFKKKIDSLRLALMQLLKDAILEGK